MKRSSARRACSPMHSRRRRRSTPGSRAAGWRARSSRGTSSTSSASAPRVGARSHRRTTSPAALPVIVLSHRAWSQHFASDPGVLNRTVRVNGAQFHVVGVMPEGFRGLAVVAAPDYWAPLSLLGQFRRGQQGREDSVGLSIVGRLKPGLSRGQALAQLLVWDSRRAAERSGERPRREPRARTEAGHGPAVGRRHAAVHAALFCVRSHPDDRLRERRQPAARARRSHASARLASGWRLARRGAASSGSCSPKACCSRWSPLRSPSAFHGSCSQASSTR